jgi:tetratricopeptide (TPR) repeat protein
VSYPETINRPKGSRRELPVSPSSEGAGCGKIRPSRRAKWRALSLILVHLLIAVHVLHWKLTGRTLTPMEPSEAMQTLELGWLNAGFVLFVLLILSTFILGRFFCGWACHLVAYQDLCGWVMKKMGLKPKPFRSRFLIFVPLFAAFYMFIYPQILRIAQGKPFPAIVYHFTTEDFWATFPNFWISILTFAVCGFLIVLALGNKGFCSYGCPYGAFFGIADRFATGKIRVTDACNGCGHCTATCTSNVRVHEEVKLYGMVVDPGCMKCMDCVSVCPNNALYYGFGKPSLLKPRGVVRAKKKYDFSLPEEMAMIFLFIASLYVYRGLYNAIPFLLAIGLSSLTAVFFVHAFQVLYRPNVRAQRLQFRKSGRILPLGWAYLSLMAFLLVFLIHSGIWQYHYHEGTRYLSQADALYQNPSARNSPALLSAAQKSLTHLKWAERHGLFPVADIENKLGSLYTFMGKEDLAERHFQTAVTLDPKLSSAYRALAHIAGSRGEMEKAIEYLRKAAQVNKDSVAIHTELGTALEYLGRHREAVEVYKAISKRHPKNAQLVALWALATARTGNFSEAWLLADSAVQLDPTVPEGWMARAMIEAQMERHQDAYNSACEATERYEAQGNKTQGAQAWLLRARLSLVMGNIERAFPEAEIARQHAPQDEEVLQYWAQIALRAKKAEALRNDLIKKASSDPNAALALGHLYSAEGKWEEAQKWWEKVPHQH